MAKGRVSSRPIHLNYRSVEKLLVEPDDKDRFMVTAREAARACKQAEDEKEWVEQFKQFLAYVGKWCKEHADQVAAGYVDIGDGSLNIIVCTKGDGYNFEFEDAITDLDLALVKAFPWSIVDVMQVPCKAKEGQLSFEKAILVYGDGN